MIGFIISALIIAMWLAIGHAVFLAPIYFSKKLDQRYFRRQRQKDREQTDAIFAKGTWVPNPDKPGSNKWVEKQQTSCSYVSEPFLMS